MFDERRLLPRYQVALPIVAGGESGLTVNVSASGVRFVCPRAFGSGAVIELVIDMSDGQLHARGALAARGRVVWEASDGHGRTETAVQFEEIRFVATDRDFAERGPSDLQP